MKNSEKRGSAFIMLLMSMVILAILSTMNFKTFFPGKPGEKGGDKTLSSDPQNFAIEAVCATNRMVIQNAVQLYTIQNGPMHELDLKKLASVMTIPELPKGATCKYRMDANGKVECTVHKNPL